MDTLYLVIGSHRQRMWKPFSPVYVGWAAKVGEEIYARVLRQGRKVPNRHDHRQKYYFD
jgi:hypothetical protein